MLEELATSVTVTEPWRSRDGRRAHAGDGGLSSNRTAKALDINREIERQATTMATTAADLPLLLYRFRKTDARGMRA